MVDKASELSAAVGGVEEALKGLTGRLAPARAFLAIALVLIVASLFPLGVLSAAASGGNGTATTTTTTKTP
jgi:hypothetical protein